MHLLVHESYLPFIKESLRKSHPETRPTHRMEAAAKGLGFSTYASFLTLIKSSPQRISVDDEMYCAALGVSAIINGEKRARYLSRSVARAMLRKVLDENPELTLRGFDSIWQGGRDELRKPKEEREALFENRRREAYNDDWAADQFELALIFLSRQKRTKSFNRQVGSYGLKHRAEDLSRAFGLFTYLGNYVSNGMLLAAAFAAGFSVKRVADDSYNAYLNVSMQTVNAARGYERNSRIEENPAIVLSMYAPATDFEPAHSA